ncbi:hypothetical protein ACJA88_014529 [Fusarium oxysporum]
MARELSGKPPQPSTLELGWNIQAPYAFFSIFVFGFSRSHMATAPGYNKAPSTGYFAASVEATSLAFLVTHLNRLDLMGPANSAYVTAIQRLNLALNGPETLHLEEALESILLLDTYEKMVCRNPRGSSLWINHPRGGISLLESCGSQVVTSNLGRQLGARLVSALTVSCGAAAVAVPEALRILRRQLDPFVNSVKWRFMGILASIVDLQADLHKGGNRCKPGPVKQAEQLDAELTRLHKGLPLSWRPLRVSPVRDHPLIFGSYYDIFPDQCAVQLANGICVMRLLLNRIITMYSPKKSSGSDSYDIACQICASVPQFLPSVAQQDETAPFSPVLRLQCCTLLAPLYVANHVSEDVTMRAWIGHCLQYMSDRGGMKIAQDVRDAMTNNLDLDYWFVVSMVGSYAFAT